MLTWLQAHQTLLWIAAGLSLVVFIGSLLITPLIVIRLPADFFVRPESARQFRRRHPVMRVLLRILKNATGAGLILAGFAMLVLPGQGVLTIVVGVLLLDFPGKRRLERRAVLLPAVWKSCDWLRRRAGVESFVRPPRDH